MPQTGYDAIIVGSGPSGMLAAAELTAQGLQVLLLEAGRALHERDFDPRKKAPNSDINIWERARAALLNGQPVQTRAAFFSRRMSQFYVNDLHNPYSSPKDAPFLWIRGRQTGGRIHSFGRVLLRWSDDDFQLASLTGRGQDWPIRYADLAPYYDEVEQMLGLYGCKAGIDSFPDGAFSAEAQYSPAEKTFQQRVETHFPGRRVTTWRYIAPDPDRMPKPLRLALATGRLQLINGAIVHRVLTDASGKVATGVEYIESQSRALRTAHARAVVLCASPIESVRLLLHSANASHPRGLANSSDTLGRYFMDQLPCLGVGHFPEAKGLFADTSAPPDAFYNPSGGIFIPRFAADAASRGEYCFQGSIGRFGNDPSAAARMSFFGFGMMLPDRDNRITLNPKRHDRWGIPIAHIRCAMGHEDRSNLRTQLAVMKETVESAGGVFEYIGSPLGLSEYGPGAYPDADRFSRFLFRRWFRRTMMMGAAIHESGGARMGEDPKTSVLDPWNRSWDVDNLLVTDASALPGSGVSGTTLTIMALTVRACRRLADQLREGALKGTVKLLGRCC